MLGVCCDIPSLQIQSIHKWAIKYLARNNVLKYCKPMNWHFSAMLRFKNVRANFKELAFDSIFVGKEMRDFFSPSFGLRH